MRAPAGGSAAPAVRRRKFRRANFISKSQAIAVTNYSATI
jgi:hypothetical protein